VADAGTVFQWVALVVGPAAVLLATAMNLRSNTRNEKQRQEHERELKQLEQQSEIAKERHQVYASLAMVTKGTDYKNFDALVKVHETHAQVEILSQNPKVLEAADDLVRTWSQAWHSARYAYEEGAQDPFDAPEVQNELDLKRTLRAAYIARVKEEINANEGGPLEPPAQR
jgi:3-methyladenine DNA glycosylase AlkD